MRSCFIVREWYTNAFRNVGARERGRRDYSSRSRCYAVVGTFCGWLARWLRKFWGYSKRLVWIGFPVNLPLYKDNVISARQTRLVVSQEWTRHSLCEFGVCTHARTYGRVDSMSVICRLRTTLGRRGCTDWPVRPFDEYLWIHGMIWDGGVQRYNMVKEKANSTRIYDSEGYRRRAACICVKNDLEDEVSQQMAAPYIFAGVKLFSRSKWMYFLLSFSFLLKADPRSAELDLIEADE